jgi:hypothetical protein
LRLPTVALAKVSEKLGVKHFQCGRVKRGKNAEIRRFRSSKNSGSDYLPFSPALMVKWPNDDRKVIFELFRLRLGLRRP